MHKNRDQSVVANWSFSENKNSKINNSVNCCEVTTIIGITWYVPIGCELYAFVQLKNHDVELIGTYLYSKIDLKNDTIDIKKTYLYLVPFYMNMYKYL